ncbi:MAG: hypothetical protein P8129_09020 [Anaerolineae bacterium]
MEWILGAVVVLMAAVAMVVAARLRRLRLRSRVSLEVTNVGNVKSRYNLRAEDPQGALRFQFTLDGDGLPARAIGRSAPARPASSVATAKTERETAGQRKGAGAREKANALMQVSNALAGLLSMVGSLLPRAVGVPLQQKASQMRRVQSQASYAQQVPVQMAWLKSSATRAVPGAPGARAAQPAPHEEAPTEASGEDDLDGGFTWSQTPYVQPGKTLAIDLLIRSLLATRDQAHTYQVISQSAELAGTDRLGAAPVVAAEGRVRIRGGFWARRFLPYLLIVLAAALLLVLIYWLAISGSLS